MRGDEFLDKMELVDADLVEAAGRQLSSTAGSNYRKGGAYMARKIAALAAVIALMICSGAVGAIAFSSETIVEVPAEQESIELEAIGLTLILPDSWEGKYGVEMDADGAGCAVYALFPHESANGWGSRGYLFWVGLAYDEPLTPQQLEERSPVPCIYLFATAEGTYDLAMASDVQYDPNDPEITEVYTTMYRQIADIQFVVNNPAALGSGSQTAG